MGDGFVWHKTFIPGIIFGYFFYLFWKCFLIEKKILQNLSMVKEKIKMGGGFVWTKTFIPGLIFGYFFLFYFGNVF